MRDNFDVYKWKQNPQSEDKQEGFDLHEWNKKRYLGELEIDQEDDAVDQQDIGGSLNITKGGDDPKTGAEQESDKNVVGENKKYLEDLASKLSSKHPDLRFNVREEPFDRIDVMGSQQDLANFGNEMHGKKFGEYEVFAVDDDDRGEVVRIVKSSSISRGKLEEASYMYKGYQDKHFDVCPAAESLRDRLKSGEFGQPDELDLGEWLYQHDVLFGIEKQVIKDKEGEPEDYNKAREAADRIINLSRDLNIPASELKYLKNHLDLIKDMIDYSALTEALYGSKYGYTDAELRGDEFSGSDPKAGSTIKGTGFMAPRQKSKVTQRDIDDIEASGNIDIAYNKAMDLLKSMTEREAVKETLRFIKENNPEFTNEEIKEELKEIKELGKQLNEKLCPKGEAYRKRRMAAGEKSSAYLSGRAVKVCKGQMSGKKKKKKK